MAIGLLKKWRASSAVSAAPLPIDRRDSERVPWERFDGFAYIASEQKRIDVVPFDISSSGLSFLSTAELYEGQILVFIKNNRAARVEVVWINDLPADANKKRYGCRRVNLENDLYLYLA